MTNQYTSTRSTSPMNRPKLTRGSITEPSLATSNASRNDLASLHCTESSASTLLARVASYSLAQHDTQMKRRSGGDSAYSSPGQSPRSERKEPFEMGVSRCECHLVSDE